MIKLTDDQRKTLLLLGDSELDLVKIPMAVLYELSALGLIQQRTDERWDFTDDGERIFDELTGGPGPWSP